MNNTHTFGKYILIAIFTLIIIIACIPLIRQYYNAKVGHPVDKSTILAASIVALFCIYIDIMLILS